MGSLDKWYVFGRDPGFDEGMRLFQSGAQQEAIKALSDFLAKKCSDRTLVRLARMYLAECFFRRAEFDEEEGRNAQACDNFQKAVELQPTFADYHVRLARSLVRDNRHDEALSAARRALEVNPNLVVAHMLVGILHYQNESIELAMNAVIDAITLQPSLDNSNYQAFAELHNAGKNEEAIEHLWVLWDSCGTDPTKGLIEQATKLASSGQYEEAGDCYLRLTELVPGYADVRCRYGETLLELGQVDAAIAQFEAALKINSKYADAMAALGVAQLRSGDPNSARCSFDQVLDWNPEHPVASEQLRRLGR